MTAASRREAALALAWELPAPRGRWRAALRLARQNPLGTLALAVLLLLCLSALFAPVIAPYAPAAQPGGRLEAPSGQYWFGTDRIGRDIFSRLLYGGRISLLVGFVAVGSGTVIGSAIGMVSGFLGGWADLIVQRCMDVIMSIPALLLAMVIVASFGRGVANALIAIAIVLIPTAARVMRSVVLQIQARSYVEAAQASGASGWRVLLRHIVPNAIDEVLILASIALAAAVIIEAALSFLGLGAQPPTASWGQMLAEGRQNYLRAPHMVWAPSLAICLTVLSVTLVGDTLRDVIDPRTRGSRATHF